MSKTFNRVLLISLIVILLGLECFSIKAIADQVILSYSKETQSLSNWCWVASAKNAVKYSYNTTKLQSDAVYYVYGNIFNYTANLQKTALAANYFSDNTMNYYYTQRGTDVGVKPYEYLKGKINIGRVIILSAGYYVNGERDGGHDVTMHGYFSYGSYASMIWYFDPDDGIDYECAYSSFKSGSFNGRMYDGTVYPTA